MNALCIDVIRMVACCCHVCKAPDLWILAPGLGFQGGNLEEAVAAGLRQKDRSGILLPVSRGISKVGEQSYGVCERAKMEERARVRGLMWGNYGRSKVREGK